MPYYFSFPVSFPALYFITLDFAIIKRQRAFLYMSFEYLNPSKFSSPTQKVLFASPLSFSALVSHRNKINTSLSTLSFFFFYGRRLSLVLTSNILLSRFISSSLQVKAYCIFLHVEDPSYLIFLCVPTRKTK